MDQLQQPKGKFYAFENDSKRAGDNRPQFIDGKITVPGTDVVFDMPATFTRGKTVDGKHLIDRMYGYTEPYPAGTAIRDRIAAKAARAGEEPKVAFETERGPFMLKAGQYIFWTNPKADEPSKNGNKQTDFFGYWNPGGDYPVFKIGSWLGEKNGRGYINGELQVPLPGKDDGIVAIDPTESFVPEIEAAEPPRARRGREASAEISR